MTWMEHVTGDHARSIADHDQLDRGFRHLKPDHEPPWSSASTLA